MQTVAVKYIGRSEHQSPERQLWCAVISRALQDALNDVATVSNLFRREQIRDDARSWFIQNDADFQTACTAAGYDPSVLRPRVLRLIGAGPLQFRRRDCKEIVYEKFGTGCGGAIQGASLVGRGKKAG